MEAKLQFHPTDIGKFRWQNDHTLPIIPTKPYTGPLSIHLAAGKFGVNGNALPQDSSWNLQVRSPLIVYLSYTDPKNELMTLPAEGGSPHQLTSTENKVVSFDVSPTGNSIVYAALNDNRQTSDLWLVDRNGQNTHRLLECGENYCSSPVWSPNGKWIAYDRAPASGNISRLWVIDQSQPKRTRFLLMRPLRIKASFWLP